jgi:hypothetical protein
MLVDQRGDGRINSFSPVTSPVGPLSVRIETEDGESLACFPAGFIGCVIGRKTTLTFIFRWFCLN